MRLPGQERLPPQSREFYAHRAIQRTSSRSSRPRAPGSLYEHAVLHILVAVAAKKWRLLFAFVELLPLDAPPPLHDCVVEGP